MTRPRVIQNVSEFIEWRKDVLKRGETIGFVPTMGALHSGHLSLVKDSTSIASRSVVSIFVNPAQFAPNEDLDAYPRTLESDLDKLTSYNVDVVFYPSIEEMYPAGIPLNPDSQTGTFVTVLGLSEQLEGQTRPHFFRGVATAVTKLVNIIRPDHIFFGQKDIQQCLVVVRMFKDLHYHDIQVHIGATVRDEDGLALSSRNIYLTSQQRPYALCLYRALSAMKSVTVEQNATASQCESNAKDIIQDVIKQAWNNDKVEIKLDYIHCADAQTLLPIDANTIVKNHKGGIVFVGAIFLGSTRLIDNIVLQDLDLFVKFVD